MQLKFFAPPGCNNFRYISLARWVPSPTTFRGRRVVIIARQIFSSGSKVKLKTDGNVVADEQETT
jgi:hypothetical protein